ncbi:retrovirus-related pol polyprotein from transposon TNT 1-94 [Tanacetum coccineum]
MRNHRIAKVEFAPWLGDRTGDLEAYDSDCDDVSTAQVVLMANLSNYGSDIISEVPHSEPYHHDMDNQSVHAMQDFEQTPVAAVQDTNLYAQQDSMILSVIEQMSEQMINHVNNWEKANQEKNNESLTAELERYKERVKTFEQRLNIDLSTQKESKYMDKEIDLEKKIKELDNIVYKVGQSAQTVHMLTKPQVFDDDTHKQALGYQNPSYLKKAQRIKPTLYDGSVISSQHVVIPVIDDEETLILEEAPRKLPKVSLVNTSLKKLKYHLGKFDTVVKKRITPDAITKGEWGFEHTKAVFLNEIISFLKTLKDVFNVFEKDLLNEEMQSSESCDKCSDLDAELLKKQNAYNELSKSYSQLEKHRISLELTMQLNQEIEQADILQGIVKQAKAKQPLDNALDFACKHAKRIQELLVYVRDTCLNANKPSEKLVVVTPINKVKKVRSSKSSSGTVRFKNDQVAKIMGYDDYQQGNVIISRVYYVEGLRHNLFYVRQFCDADLEVAFRKNTCFIRNLEGVDLLSGSRDTNLSKDEAPDAIIKCIKNIQVSLNATVRNVRTDNGTEFVNQTLRDLYENVGISHQTSVARTPQQNGVVERQNQTLVEAARTMLIFSKAPLFLWAEAINTACYTQNRSLIRLRYNKTPYELMHDKKPDLSFFHVFGSPCYPTNDSEELGKINEKADIDIFVGYAPTEKAFRIYNRRTRKIIETF